LRTENAPLDLPLDAYMFRPGFIQPLHGVTSKTAPTHVLESRDINAVQPATTP